MPPEYEMVDDSNLVLRIPAAKLELVPADATVTVHSGGEPLAGIEVLALFPNKTWVRAITDDAGEAALALYTTHLPMTIHAAGPGYAAGLERAWTPNRGGMLLELEPLESGGAAIFAQGTGHLPGLRGRLNPIRDASDRTWLYADNIAIDDGRQQPVPFRPGKPMRLDGRPRQGIVRHHRGHPRPVRPDRVPTVQTVMVANVQRMQHPFGCRSNPRRARRHC